MSLKQFYLTLSAVLAGKAELREVIESTLERWRLYQKKTTLFVKDVVETPNPSFRAEGLTIGY